MRTGGNREEDGENYGYGEGGDVPIIGRDFLDGRAGRIGHARKG